MSGKRGSKAQPEHRHSTGGPVTACYYARFEVGLSVCAKHAQRLEHPAVANAGLAVKSTAIQTQTSDLLK